MAAGVQVLGLSELTTALTRIGVQLNVATRTATAHAAHLLEREIKQELSKSSHRKGTPTPSRPGEPPAVVTGTLRRSITVKGPHPLGAARWEAEVGPTAVYGRIQELGGVAGRGGATQLPARPYVQPAFNRLAATGALSRVYHSAWRTAISH